MEEEIYLGGEGDDVCGSQIPAGRVKGQGSEVRVSSASPILQGREAGVPAPLPPRLPVPQAFSVPRHAEASFVVGEVAG